MFEMRCQENGIEHRYTRINHPWTTDEVEQSLLRDLMLFSGCPWVTAPRRAGHEVRARPRSVSVAPPLRRLWAPSVHAVSSPDLPAIRGLGLFASPALLKARSRQIIGVCCPALAAASWLA